MNVCPDSDMVSQKTLASDPIAPAAGSDSAQAIPPAQRRALPVDLALLQERVYVGGEILGHKFDNFDNTGVDVDATAVSVRGGVRF